MTGPPTDGRRTLTLAIDAATYVGTVAVLDGARLVAEGEAAMRGEQEERLMPAVRDALSRAGAGPADVAEVVCGAGPGSFTSLRIAASIVKGLATGRSVPMLAVSSLWLVAAGARPALAAGDYLAVLDAMRGEWFGAAITVGADGRVVAGEAWSLFPVAALDEQVRGGAAVIGPGPWGGVSPHARGVALLDRSGAAAARLRVDLDRWEPDYGRKAEAQVRWEATHGRPLAGGW